MITVGVRELKARTSEIVRLVRDDHECIAITYRGKVVARIIPEQSEKSLDTFETRWERRMQLAEEIGRYWTEGLTSAEAIAEDRR